MNRIPGIEKVREGTTIGGVRKLQCRNRWKRGESMGREDGEGIEGLKHFCRKKGGSEKGIKGGSGERKWGRKRSPSNNGKSREIKWNAEKSASRLGGTKSSYPKGGL